MSMNWMLKNSLLSSCALLVMGYSLSFLLPDIPYQLRMFIISNCTKRKTLLRSNGDTDSNHSIGSRIPTDEHIALVYPTDIDGNMHMNNARYLRELNFARRKYFYSLSIWDVAAKRQINFIVRAQNIRYRKELKLWDKYCIVHHIAGWSNKEKCFYIEARFVRDSFVMAVQFCKYIIVHAQHGSTSKIPRASDILVEAGLLRDSIGHEESIPPAFVAWEQSNTISSKELRA